MFETQAHIQVIEPTKKKYAYLNWTLDIPSIEGYKNNLIALLRVEDIPPTHPHVQHHPLLFIGKLTLLPLLMTLVALQHTRRPS